MNVRTLCLSVLYSHEASGYEIRKLCTEGECSYFVEASFGSIYPALAKLEAEGLVTSRIEHQSGKPSKKIYAITDAGRETFVESLKEPIGPDVYRSPFLLFARFAHLLDADLVRTRIEDQIARLDADILELREIGSELKSQENQEVNASHANDAWVVRYGITCLEVAREQLQTHMNDLIATARSEESAAARAAE